MNRLGICDWYMLTPGVAAIKQAKKLGCDYIQIEDLGGMTRNYPMRDKRIQDEYKEAAEQAQVVLYSYQASGLYKAPGMQSATNSARFDAAIEEFKLGLEVCKNLSIPSIMLASAAEAHCSNDEEFKNTAFFLKKAAAMAIDSGIEIAYEHFCSTDRLLWLMDYVGEGMRLAFDSQNPIRDGFGDPLEIIEQVGKEKIIYAHLKDSPASLIGCAPLGEGVCKVRESIELLLKVDYEGPFFEENKVFVPPFCFECNGLDMEKRDLDYIQSVIDETLYKNK